MNQSAGCASFASTSNPGWSTRDECASSLGSKPPKSSTRCSNTAPLVRRAPPTALVLRRRARTGSTTPPRTRAVCPEPTDRREPPALAPRLPTPPGSPPFSPHSGTLQASTPTAPPPIGSRRIERAERTRSEHRISTTILYRHRRSAGYTGVAPKLIIINELWDDAWARHLWDRTPVFDMIARAETTRDRIGGFGRASAASEWLVRHAAPIACRSV